jgi:hypothetical protein
LNISLLLIVIPLLYRADEDVVPFETIIFWGVAPVLLISLSWQLLIVLLSLPFEPVVVLKSIIPLVFENLAPSTMQYVNVLFLASFMKLKV